MLIYLLLLSLSLSFIKAETESSIEDDLKTDIFNKYNKNSRPNGVVNIGLELILKQVVGLDEKNQIMITSSLLIAQWTDKRLAWNHSTYNINHISVKANQIWLPDLFIINTADSNGFIPVNDFNLAYTQYDGKITINYGLIGKISYFNLTSLKIKTS